MMKRLIYIISVIALIVSSCTQENFPDNGERENCITLKISNSTMDTKATKEGSEVENTINSLDFYFFPEGGTELPSTYHKRITYDGGIQKKADVHLYITDGEFRDIFPNADQNNCVVFVIANLPESSLPGERASTTLQALKQIRVENSFIGEDNKPVTPASFVMQGEQILTRSSNVANSVTGEVDLKRVASKITLRIKLPDYILVPKTDQSGNVINQVWRPELTKEGDAVVGVGHTYARMNNGVSADLIASEYTPASSEYFNTVNIDSFTYESSTESFAANSSGAYIHTFTCDLPFYSYSSGWDHGDIHAPSFILQIPWKDEGSESYTTHYYQVQINSFGRELAPNHWYDLTLNVGVLGSTVATLPKEIQNCSYQVLDWSTIVTVFEKDEEDIHLDEWQYLIIDESQVVMNNETTGTFFFDASHPIAWNLEWPQQNEFTGDGYQKLINGFDEIEREYNSSTKYASYYLNCTDLNAVPKCLNNNRENDGHYNLINNDCFSVDGRTFNFQVPSRIVDQSDTQIYTPVYVHVKVWLDMDDDDQLDENEREHVFHLTFVYNPAMYIIPDPSTLRSIYVNGKRASYTSGSDETTDIGRNYPLGSINGVRNFQDNNQNKNYSMYIINVTAFSDNIKFIAPHIENGYFKGVNTGNYNNGSHTEPNQPATTSYNYIIGDPRSRSIDNALGGGEAVKGAWSSERALYDEQGNQANENYTRGLTFYYPTLSDGDAFRVIAPKYRIVSFNNASGKNCTHHSAAMRCASLQEDGFPAGRWRLPTVAEIQYIIMLQEQGAIQPIFTSSGSYYATSSYSDAGHTKRISVAYRDGELSWNSLNSNISVRCVYDDWYWGSDRDAIVNKGANEIVRDENGVEEVSNQYYFTWGDKPIY